MRYNPAVRKKGAAEDLSVEELRRLLVEKRRSARQERIARFRKTGRVVTLVPDSGSQGLESLRSSAIEDTSGTDQDTARSRIRSLFNGVLLLVEVGAVLGLFFVIFSGLEVIQDLNKQVSEVLEQPTVTPTPLVMLVVLPSGHTPPTSPLGARPNEEEIPEHLRPLVQSLGSVPIPTPAPEHTRHIRIPAIDVYASVVQGDGWEQLKKGVAQTIGTANPGQQGNVVLSAHNDIFGEIFRYLDRLKPGDEIILDTSQRSYTYIVTGTQIVEPTQVEVMYPTEDPTVTLISCYPYLIDNKRIVVTAKLSSSGQ
jgi:sortase A